MVRNSYANKTVSWKLINFKNTLKRVEEIEFKKYILYNSSSKMLCV